MFVVLLKMLTVMWMKVISEFFLWIDMNTSWNGVFIVPIVSLLVFVCPLVVIICRSQFLRRYISPRSHFETKIIPKAKVDDWPNDRRRRRARLVSEFDLLPKYGKHTRNLLYQVQPVQRTINKNGQQRETKQEDWRFAEGLPERRHGPHSFRLACKFRDKERR